MKIKEFKDVRNLLLIFAVMIGGGYVLFTGISYFTFAQMKKVLRDGEICIPTGVTLSEQAALLHREGFIADTSEYLLFARKMSTKTRSGKFNLKQDMSFKELLHHMRWGEQIHVVVRFNDIWNCEMLAGVLAPQIELDSIQIMETFANDSLISSLGLNVDEAFYMCLPDTYHFYWNITGKELLIRMKHENDTFWAAKDRGSKLKALDMTVQEVRTLASIVQRESNHYDDMRMIAGIYINRLRKRIPLQACPTVKYALNEPSLRRVLHAHLEVDSPYNTYKHAGLPPGPIGLATRKGIDAVLNYTPSNNLYFCATPEMDGKHRFATNFNDHSRNAQQYTRALNRAGI